jgi:3',5'-cyclic AMP phosphodiesterase CpdA
MFRILQLSDFHFGTSHGFAQLGDPGRTLADVIVRSLERAGTEPWFDSVVLNGDLFSLNDADERAKAEDGVRKLLGALEVGHLAPVPGNHDISWDPKLRHRERLDFYHAIVSRLAPATPHPRDYPHIIRLDGEERPGIALILLDSCRIESQAQAGLGYVGGDQLDLLDRRLQDAAVSRESHTLLAVQHHHLLPVAQAAELPVTADPNASPRMVVSVTVDATDVLRELTRVGVSVVMHGHQHVQAVLSFANSRWNRSSPLVVAACGSCGIDEVGVRRHFNLWEFEGGEVTVLGFEEHPDDRELFVEGSRQLLALDWSSVVGDSSPRPSE